MTAGRAGPRVCIVGSGTRFVSGISYYTYFLAAELSSRCAVSAILMRRLVPRWLYPGRRRVGAPITALRTADVCPTFDGVDWFGFPSILRALRFLGSQRPEVLVLQWWTGSVLPWYWLLVLAARRRGCAVVLELHEDIDTGEAGLPLVGSLARRALGGLIRRTDRFVVHSSWDRQRMAESLGLPTERTWVVPHGPYPMAARAASPPAALDRGATTVLFFGTIRPYKGLEHLVSAFDLLPRSEDRTWRLLVVGEPWQGWTEPFERIAASPHRDEIEVIDRYVTDAELPALFARADVVALPYLRSSASGPLHLTMSAGLPVVVSSVGGLVEATAGYHGAVLVPPADAGELAKAIVAASGLRGIRFEADQSWGAVGDAYQRLLDEAVAGSSRGGPSLVGAR